jgi:hypothetical protein
MSKMGKYKVSVVRTQRLSYTVVATNGEEALMVLRNLWQRTKADEMEYGDVEFVVDIENM